MKDILKSLIEDINEIWEEHLKAKFPDDFSGKDINGIDFVLLDSNIAGCVSSFIDDGNLNIYQTAILGLNFQRVDFVVPVLNEEGSAYFWRLGRLAELVLEAVAHKNRAEHLKDR